MISNDPTAVPETLEELCLHREVSYYRERESKGVRLEAFMGASARTVELRTEVARLSCLSATVAPTAIFIRGETGTEKDLVARVLHYAGARADGPFLPVSCTAIPESTIEVELLGRPRNTSTHVESLRGGLFRLAEGGTIFLDELDCLPWAMQVKILKAAEKSVLRRRSVGTVPGRDVQIIAATNADLKSLLGQRALGEDFLSRVALLTVPPLRERGEDVLILAHAYLLEHAARYRLPMADLSEGAQRMIAAHHWPGNVRELQNALDRALYATAGATMDASALELSCREAH